MSHPVSTARAFNPSHVLVSRNRKTPVQLLPAAKGFKVLTELEWQAGQEPAFEMHPRQGFFCKGIPVVGFKLQPLDAEAAQASSTATTHA